MSRLAIFLFLSLYFTLNASAQSTDVLFIIEEDSVDVQEFEYVYSKNNSLREEAYEREDIEEYLELYINFKLKVREATSLGYDTTTEFLTEYNSYRDQLAKPYLTQESFKDSLINQAYNRYKEIINASHILILMDKNETDTTGYYNKISDIYSKSSTNKNFEDLARNYSEEPNASTTGGNLGYFTSMQMVYPFENVAYNTEVEEVSSPFRTDFGYHILKVNDRKKNPGKVEVSHIMLRYKKDMSPEDSVILENRANTLYSDLSRSVNSWDSLCLKYSEDLRTRENGGKLNPFGVGEIIPIFAEKSFSIEEIGGISKPFQSPYGWHIVKLDSIIPIPSKESFLPEIRSKVLRGDRLSAGKESSAKALKLKFSYSENYENFNLLDQYLQSKLYKINSLPIDIENSILFNLDTAKYQCHDLKEYLTSKYSKKRIQDSSVTIDLDKEFNDFVYSELESLEKLNLQINNPEYSSILKEYKEGMLLFEIMEDKVWNAASTDSIGINNYYSAHLDQYTAFDSANLIIFEVDLNELDSIVSLVNGLSPRKKVRDFENTWVKISEWNDTQYDDFYSRRTESKSLIGYALDYKEDTTIPLNEIKGKVISDYQKQLESSWLESLHSKYQVIRNEKEIENAINILSNE